MITYARVENNSVLDVIDFDPNGRFHDDIAKLYEQIPSGTKPNAVLISGEWINPPDPPPLTQEQIDFIKAQQEAEAIRLHGEFLRKERNDLLTKSDWTQARDLPSPFSTAWAVYRQALRDLPQQSGFPTNVIWPTVPKSNPMDYVYIEDGVIKEGPMKLPRSWRDLSALDYMTNAELLAIGWKPYRIDEGEVNEVYTGSVVEIFDTEVVETKQWTAKT